MTQFDISTCLPYPAYGYASWYDTVENPADGTTHKASHDMRMTHYADRTLNIVDGILGDAATS
jgi:hypothetical protein